jgi:hypothetical protein
VELYICCTSLHGVDGENFTSFTFDFIYIYFVYQISTLLFIIRYFVSVGSLSGNLSLRNVAFFSGVYKADSPRWLYCRFQSPVKVSSLILNSLLFPVLVNKIADELYNRESCVICCFQRFQLCPSAVCNRPQAEAIIARPVWEGNFYCCVARKACGCAWHSRTLELGKVCSEKM